METSNSKRRELEESRNLFFNISTNFSSKINRHYRYHQMDNLHTNPDNLSFEKQNLKGKEKSRNVNDSKWRAMVASTRNGIHGKKCLRKEMLTGILHDQMVFME